MPMPLHPADLVDSRPVWLLQITWASRVYRFSTEPLSLTDAAGMDLPFHNAMTAPQLEQSLDRLETEPAESSASMRVVFPVDVAAERAKGYDPVAATGELSMVLVTGPPGYPTPRQTYEQRYRLLVGRLVNPQWSEPEEASGWMAFTLREEAWQDTQTAVPLSWRITLESWTLASLDQVGKVYPWVFGSPGVYTDSAGATQKKGATPAYIIEIAGGNVNKLLIAGHPVIASTVTIFDSTTSQSFAVSHQTEAGFTDHGQQVAYVDITTPGAISRTESEYWVCWDGGGGLANPFGSGALEKLGDVLQWVLTLGTIPVDYGRWAAVAGLLNGRRVGGYINDPDVLPFDYAVEHLLPLAPISVMRGPDGLYPVHFDPDLPTSQSVLHVTAGEAWTRVGAIQAERNRDDVVNALELSYAIGHEESSRMVLVTGARNTDDADETHTNYARISQERYGVSGSALSSAVLWEDASAQGIAADLVRFGSLQLESAPYATAWSEGWIQVGDQLTITDAAAAWVSQRVVVYKRQPSDTGWEFLVMRDDDPAHDARAL